MKILQVISSFPPAYAYGGPARSVYNTASALVDRGHDVTVYTTDAKDADERVTDYENPERIDGVEVFRFRNVSNVLSWRNLPLSPGMWRALRRHVNDFDIVHSHEFRSFQTWFAHRAAKSAGVPHVLQPRGTVPRGSKTRLKWVLDAVFGKRLLAEADKVIASSESEASQFAEVQPVEGERVEKVPNGIDADEFDLLPEGGTFRQEYRINSDVPVVLFLGRLHKRKGGNLLVSAFARLRETHPNARLVFVGPDEGARESLEAQVRELGMADNVLFTGPLYENSKLAAYRDSDVFVLPSTDCCESFGNVVLEAIACGTPAVVTVVCGVTEYLPGRFSTAVEPSIEDVSAGIRNLIEKPKSDTEAMISFLTAELSWASVAERTELVYQSLVETEE